MAAAASNQGCQTKGAKFPKTKFLALLACRHYPDADLGVGQNARFAPRVGRQMRLDFRKLRFRQPKLVATHLCLLFGSRESRHYARANTFMSPDPKVRGFVALVKKNPAGVTG